MLRLGLRLFFYSERCINAYFYKRQRRKQMNVLKLKGKMVEKGFAADSLAKAIGIDKSTFYRKTECLKKFSVGEAQKIKEVLHLTDKEFMAIFFDSKGA